jgi:hypothetical protein
MPRLSLWERPAKRRRREAGEGDPVPVKLGPITLPFGKSDDDPYWERFIKSAPADQRNAIAEMLRNQPEGAVAPTKADLHTPEITSTHIKELAVYVGSDLTGIARLPNNPDGFDFAIVCVVKAEHDPRSAPGIGGQTPVMNGRFSTFVIAAYIRELGFRATTDGNPNPDDQRLAVAAGLGHLNADGRLVTAKYGDKVHVAEIIRTDLPLSPDGEFVSARSPSTGEGQGGGSSSHT